MIATMTAGNLIANERQAREIANAIAEIDIALSSDQAFKSIVAGLPHEVINGVARSLETERNQLKVLLSAYQKSRLGDFSEVKKNAGNDPGAFLIASRLIRKLSQKDLARKLGLREQAIQRWEAERYRSISLSNFQKIAQTLGVQWQFDEKISLSEQWGLSYDVSREDLTKVLRHARQNGWLDTSDSSDENAISTLVRYVGDHVTRYGTPSLLRTGLNVVDHAEDWPLLSWKAQVTRRAEKIANKSKLVYRPINISWLKELVHLSQFPDGPFQAQSLLLENGIVLIIEPQIPGMRIDGSAFLVDDTPVIGLTLLRDSIDNFWFTLLHEVAHIVLHYRTGLSSGFFDDIDCPDIDKIEDEANKFAGNLLIPEELWSRSAVRITKTVEPVERFAMQLKIHPAIVFGRIRMERNDYKIFSNKIGRGTLRKQFLPNM